MGERPAVCGYVVIKAIRYTIIIKMLPDFPKEKTKLIEFFNNYLKQQFQQHAIFFKESPKFMHHEGDKWVFERDNGEKDESSYSTIESAMTLDREHINVLSFDEILKKLDSMAAEMAEQQISQMTEKVATEVNRQDRAIKLENNSFGKNDFLRALESIDLSFDKNHKLIKPSFIMPPEMWDKIQKEGTNWEDDLAFQKRHDAIIAKKKEEWLAREATRKLVD